MKHHTMHIHREKIGKKKTTIRDKRKMQPRPYWLEPDPEPQKNTRQQKTGNVLELNTTQWGQYNIFKHVGL